MSAVLSRWSQGGVKEPISYFLLGKKIYFILNANARSGNVADIMRVLSKGFPLYSFNVVLSSTLNVVSDLTRDVLSEESLFIVLGGDGTFNNTIQHLTYTPATFALIPKGTANDLASCFKIPADIVNAVRIISEGHRTTVDTIRVNTNHLVTIGSLGLPALVAHEVNEFKKDRALYKWIHRNILRSSIYSIFLVLVLLLKGRKALQYEGRVETDDELFFEGKFTALFFGKQEFLGKNFRPCPGVRHSDPFMKVSVLKYSGLWSTLKDIFHISRGRPDRARYLQLVNANSFCIRTDRFMPMLGDGEILDHDDEFYGKRMPAAIRLVVPRSEAKS